MKLENLPVDTQLFVTNYLSRLIIEHHHMKKEPMEKLAQKIKSAFVNLYYQS